MDCYHLCGTGTGGFSRPGGAATERADDMAEFVWRVGIKLGGDRKRGGGV